MITWVSPGKRTIRQHLIRDHGIGKEYLVSQTDAALQLIHDIVHTSMAYEKQRAIFKGADKA